jgi:hypothetical protein
MVVFFIDAFVRDAATLRLILGDGTRPQAKSQVMT